VCDVYPVAIPLPLFLNLHQFCTIGRPWTGAHGLEFPVAFNGFYKLHAPFLKERRTRGLVRGSLQEIRAVCTRGATPWVEQDGAKPIPLSRAAKSNQRSDPQFSGTFRGNVFRQHRTLISDTRNYQRPRTPQTAIPLPLSSICASSAHRAAPWTGAHGLEFPVCVQWVPQTSCVFP